MKTLNCIAGVLLIIGGLNLGLIGLFHFDLIATILGQGTMLARMAYLLVGVSAVYQIFHCCKCIDRGCDRK